MREVKLLKHLPWLVLFLLWAAGATLWTLYTREQESHLLVVFQNQLERTADELFRGQLQGRLGPDALPEGIRAFAVYGPHGDLMTAWGLDAPERVVVPSGMDFREGRSLSPSSSGWRDFVKVLVPLRPRMEFWADQLPPPGPPGPRETPDVPAERPRPQGFLFVRVSDAPLEGRLWLWKIGAAVGAATWAGFLAFVGLLWFRVRRYQAALAQHRELLQFAEASRTLSHELKNPLAAILLQTALLKRSAQGTPSAEVTIIEEEAQRMSSLVTRVRDFLKDPRGQAEVADLLEVVGSLRDRFAVAVEVRAEGPGPFRVAFDPHRLRSVLENLLKNAVESGPDPRPVVTLGYPKAGWVRLEVLDSGAGFTNEGLRRARTPFFTTKTTGTGIGLSISDGFVTAAGGKLKLENRPGGGAKVTLDLPQVDEEEAR